jgi:hypothetical protein
MKLQIIESKVACLEAKFFSRFFTPIEMRGSSDGDPEFDSRRLSSDSNEEK